VRHFRVFQKRIASYVSLGEFSEPVEGKPDIRIRPRRRKTPARSLRWYHHVSDHNGVKFSSFARFRGAYFVRMHGTAEFLIDRRGRWIECRLLGMEENLVAQLLSFVIPFAITLGGAQVLHASAARLSKGAVAFMGTQGMGKSTMAAAFFARGFVILTDDAMPIRSTRLGFFAVPSFPEIRLSKATTRQLLGDGRLRSAARAFRKKRVRISDRFAVKECPLLAIYVLERETGPRAGIRIEPLAPRDALLFLLNNSYRIDPEDRARMRGEALNLLALAGRIPVRRLVYPRRLSILPRVVSRVLRDQGLEGV
jgi:hypothetical protein